MVIFLKNLQSKKDSCYENYPISAFKNISMLCMKINFEYYLNNLSD